MNTKIIFNGKEYGSVHEMPPEVFATYKKVMTMVVADSDGNGIPDILEGKGSAGANITTQVTSQIVVNGREYQSLDEVPAEDRRAIQAAASISREGITLRGSALWLILALGIVFIVFRLLSH
jgi:hypothetical protein